MDESEYYQDSATTVDLGSVLLKMCQIFVAVSMVSFQAQHPTDFIIKTRRLIGSYVHPNPDHGNYIDDVVLQVSSTHHDFAPQDIFGEDRG